jgi:hypothetical protein
MKWINPRRINGVTNLTSFIWSEASKELSSLSSSTFFLSGKLPEHEIWNESIERDWRMQDLKSAIPILGNFIYSLPPMWSYNIFPWSTTQKNKKGGQLHPHPASTGVHLVIIFLSSVQRSSELHSMHTNTVTHMEHKRDIHLKITSREHIFSCLKAQIQEFSYS